MDLIRSWAGRLFLGTIVLLAGDVASAAPPPVPARPAVPAVKPAPRPAAVEGIDFADPFLASQFHAFLEAGEDAAPKSWNRSALAEAPAGKFRPAFYWKKWSDQPASDEVVIWKAEKRPSAGTVVMARSESNDSQKVGVVSLYGWAMPEKGWGAGVLYQCSLVAGKVREELTVRVYAPDQQQLTFVPTLEFPSFRATASREYPKSVLRRHSVTVMLPTDLPGYWNTFPKGKLPIGLVGSDDDFLKAALDNLADLRRTAQETIPAGTAWFEVVDYSRVRSDNPPRAAPVSDVTKPDESRRKELLADVVRSLDAQETHLKANAKEMSAAIRAAFPFRTALENVK